MEEEGTAEDQGRFATQADGSLKQAHSVEYVEASDTTETIAAGIFSVTVGERHFTCLRIYDFVTPVTETRHDASIAESYVTEEGRTVLVWHFCNPERPMYNDQENWDKVVVNEDVQIVINDVTFVHYCDT